MIQRETSGWLLEHNLPHVCGIDRNPAVAAKIHFRTAMLRFRHLLRRSAEALVSQLGLRNSNAVHVAGGKARSAREANVKRIEIGALAAQIARLQHEADV